MKVIAEKLGMGEYYKYLPIILLWRSKSVVRLGDMPPEADRKALMKADAISFEKINLIMQNLPEEMIFIIRTSNLIHIHNVTLGGSNRERLLVFARTCLE
jgi:hypothetical protein